MAAFKPVEPDTYKIKLTLSGGLEKEYDPPMEGSEGVSLGECPVHVVQIVPILNLVTPLLTVDREEARSKAGDAKEVKKDIHVFRPEKTVAKGQPEVIAIKLSYRESHSDIAFDKGGFLAINGAVTLWDDANCKKKIEPKDGRVPFRNSELKSGKTIYMKGEAAGPVNLVFTLENSAKDRVKLEASATKAVKFKLNRVTPQITVEHLVVLLDQELWKEQRKNDTQTGSAAVTEAVRIHPDATWIDLAAVQESQHPDYTGKGKLTCSPKNVKFFGNEECTNPFDVDQPIEFAKIAAAKPLRLWLRGEKAGKFNLELKLDAATDPSITVDGPAKGEMGCVELKLKLHHFKQDDVNKAIEPNVADANTFWNQLKGLTLEQAEMTKAERIGTGRTLHVQKDKHHARAKLVVEKIEASHWPDAAKDYAVVLAAADRDKVKKTHSGELKLFTLEEEGVEKVLPHKVKLSDLKSVEQTLWVEGTVACTSWRDRRLSVGFDGPEGGPEKPAKMDGDWAAFTIVEIKEVKIDYTPEANKAVAWDKATKKFCINYKRDPNGRKVTIGAKLSVELADVTVHFMLAPDKDNLKASNSGKDLPATWVWKDIDASVKHKDREDRKKLLHLSAKTDSKGYAKVEVLLSRFGGDKFWPGSYLDQDPHLAKYVHGHADLAKRKPVQSTDTITVWRKFWYQTVKVDGIAAPGFGGAEGQYASIKADMTGAFCRRH